MEMQQSDAEEEGSFAGYESYNCISCRFVLIVLLSIGIVLDIIAIVYYAIVPSQESDVLIVLGISLVCVIFACGVIIYFRTRRSSKSSNHFQSSSEEIYDVPWDISEEAEDYGIMNPGMQSSLPRCTAEAGIHESRKQRHPVNLTELEALEYKSTDNGEFNYFTNRPELLQHQTESRNEVEHSQSSFKVRDERQGRRLERKEWSPINGLEETGQRYGNSNKIDRRELEENVVYWSRRGRCRSRYIQGHGTELDVHQGKSAKLLKQKPRSKSEPRDYKDRRNMTVRENLFLSNRQSKQNPSNCSKKTECSLAKETEMVQCRNIQKKRFAQLLSKKSDSSTYSFKRKRDCIENEKEQTVYNQKVTNYRQQIPQCNRKTCEHPSNRNENIDPRKETCSPTSRAYKMDPAPHRQHKVPLHSESERMQDASEYGRIMNCSLANTQRIGKYTFGNSHGIQAVQPKDGNRINSVFETEVTAHPPRSRKIMHFQSPGARMLSPKFIPMERRYLGRSRVSTVPFSSGRTENLEPSESVKYPSIGNVSSEEYSPECSEGPHYFSEQTAVKLPFQATRVQEQNLSEMRQNSSNCRKSKESHTNEYSEAVNQPLNLENKRYIIRNKGVEYSRNVENQNRTQQRIGEYEPRRNEMVIDSMRNNTVCVSYPQRYSIASVII